MEKLELRKESFQHALNCLAHPVAILSIALLFLNDFFFRIAFPGWWTGKLGDVAWLFFFPFLLAAVLIWILPYRLLSQHNAPILITTAFTGLIFTLGKTWGPFHQGLVTFMEWIFGWQVGWVLDPTDLITLVSLPACYLLWRKIQSPKPIKHLKIDWRWVLLPVAALLGIANSAGPDTGITCIDVIDNDIYVRSSRGTFKASSGGLEWEMISTYDDPEFNNSDCDTHNVYSMDDVNPEDLIFERSHPSDTSVVFRVTPNEMIEYSSDGGSTWDVDHVIPPESQAEWYLFYKYSDHRANHTIVGPFDADFDPVNGNLIFAMGYYGVLVRDADGIYHWVKVGTYQHYEYGLTELLTLLFPGEFALALAAGMLSSATFLLYNKKYDVYLGFMIGCILIILFLGFITPPVLNFGLHDDNSYAILIVIVMLAIGIFLLIASIRHAKQKGFALLTGLISTILLFLSYIAWGYNILHDYTLAFAVGILLCSCWTYYRHRRLALIILPVEANEEELPS